MVCDIIYYSLRPYKEYIKVTLSGLLAAAIIQSIFLFLTNVDTLRVIPVKGGINCWAKESIDNDYCDDTMPDIMYSALHPDPFNNFTNITNTFIFQTTNMKSTMSFFDFSMNTTMIEYSPKWDCRLATDYRDAPFFETFLFTFTSAHGHLIILVIFTFIYVFFAMTHDWTLIYYKNNLDQVSFLPTSRKEFFLLSCLPSCIWSTFFKFQETCRKGCCCCILLGLFYFIIVLLIFLYFVVDALLTHTIMPLIWFLQGLFCKKQRYRIWTISYISASYVGIARFWMTFSAIGILGKSVYGFSFEIPAWDPDKCECECVYVFNQWDLYRLFLTTSLFVIVNVKFLWSWTMEAAHGKHYLYLITHTLPVEYANNINPRDCTGSMMKDIGQDKLKQQIMEMVKSPTEIETLLALSAELHELDEKKIVEGTQLQSVGSSSKYKDEDDENDENGEENSEEWDEEIDHIFGFGWRAIILVLAVAYYVIYGAMTLLALVVNNYYGYPAWALFLGSMGAILIFFGGIYFELKSGKYLLKVYEKKRFG